MKKLLSRHVYLLILLVAGLSSCSKKEDPVPEERIHLTAEIDGKKVLMRLGDFEMETQWDGAEKLEASFAGGDIRNFFTINFTIHPFTGPGVYTLENGKIAILYHSDHEDVIWISSEGEIVVTALSDSEFKATFEAVLVDMEGKSTQTKKLQSGVIRLDMNSR